MSGAAVLEDEDINEAISTPEMGSWEGIIEVVVATLCERVTYVLQLCFSGLQANSTGGTFNVVMRVGLQVICQTEFKTQVAYRVRGPITYAQVTALVRQAFPFRSLLVMM